MRNILKFATPLVLLIALIGCQSDAEEETAQQQSPQQSQPRQQPGQMGQMQQAAPDIDVSDEEAKQFVNAAMEAQSVQMDAQKKMVGIIEEEGLDVETYQQIARANQPQVQAQQGAQGQATPDTNFSESEIEKFEAALQELQEAQTKIRKDVMAAVEESGMDPQRFQQINRAIQQDPQLQKKVQQIMMQQQGMPSQQQMQQPPSQN